jgi:hypothetical protein
MHTAPAGRAFGRRGEGLIVDVQGLLCYPKAFTEGGSAMPSNTKITETKRKRKKANLGKKRKKLQSKQSTPAFSIHVEKDVSK